MSEFIKMLSSQRENYIVNAIRGEIIRRNSMGRTSDGGLLKIERIGDLDMLEQHVLRSFELLAADGVVCRYRKFEDVYLIDCDWSGAVHEGNQFWVNKDMNKWFDPVLKQMLEDYDTRKAMPTKQDTQPKREVGKWFNSLVKFFSKWWKG